MAEVQPPDILVKTL